MEINLKIGDKSELKIIRDLVYAKITEKMDLTGNR